MGRRSIRTWDKGKVLWARRNVLQFGWIADGYSRYDVHYNRVGRITLIPERTYTFTRVKAVTMLLLLFFKKDCHLDGKIRLDAKLVSERQLCQTQNL